MPGFSPGFGMRPFNLGNNLMFNDMTMVLGLNPFSSDSMLAGRDQNSDDIVAPGGRGLGFGRGFGGFGIGFGGFGGLGYGGFGGFGFPPYGFGMQPYGFGGGYWNPTPGPYTYGGPGSMYATPGYGGQGGYNAQTPAYGAQPAYGTPPPTYAPQPPAYGVQPPAYGAQPPVHDATQPSTAYGAAGPGTTYDAGMKRGGGRGGGAVTEESREEMR